MSQAKIYVGNLPYNTTEDDLNNHFAQYGSIEEVKLITDRDTGRSKGFGFITFASDAEGEKALESNGAEFGGRKINVNTARENTGGGRGGRDSRGGGRGGRSGGGGGRGGFHGGGGGRGGNY